MCEFIPESDNNLPLHCHYLRSYFEIRFLTCEFLLNCRIQRLAKLFPLPPPPVSTITAIMAQAPLSLCNIV